MLVSLPALQERQLQEAAKSNEEAQAVINQLSTSLQQLELRFKQVKKRADPFGRSSLCLRPPKRRTGNL